MLDNLREDADASPYYDDDEIPDFLDDIEGTGEGKDVPDPFEFLNPIRKMSSGQRFIIALLLFMLVCLVGSMVLLVTGKFALAF